MTSYVFEMLTELHHAGLILQDVGAAVFYAGQAMADLATALARTVLMKG